MKMILLPELKSEMEKYSLKCAAPVFFGDRPTANSCGFISNGSASLIVHNEKYFALTCSHVLDGYRQYQEKISNLIFQISNLELDPFDQLILEDKSLDYAIFELTKEQAEHIQITESPFGKKFFAPLTTADSKPLTTDDFVAFGGFPGEL